MILQEGHVVQHTDWAQGTTLTLKILSKRTDNIFGVIVIDSEDKSIEIGSRHTMDTRHYSFEFSESLTLKELIKEKL